jgi:hypothetical protein
MVQTVALATQQQQRQGLEYTSAAMAGSQVKTQQCITRTHRTTRHKPCSSQVNILAHGLQSAEHCWRAGVQQHALHCIQPQ